MSNFTHCNQQFIFHYVAKQQSKTGSKDLAISPQVDYNTTGKRLLWVKSLDKGMCGKQKPLCCIIVEVNKLVIVIRQFTLLLFIISFYLPMCFKQRSNGPFHNVYAEHTNTTIQAFTRITRSIDPI